MLLRKRLKDFAEHVRRVIDALEDREFFTIVIVQMHRAEESGVLDDQINRLRCSLGRPQGKAHHRAGEGPAIDGDDLLRRSKPGFEGRRADEHIGDGSISARQQSGGEVCVDGTAARPKTARS